MTSVVIFEFDPGGHHLDFLRNIDVAVRELGITPTILVTENVVRSQDFRLLLSEEQRDAVQVLPLDHDWTTGQRPSVLTIVKSLVRDERLATADFVYLPSGDAIAQFMGLLSRLPGGAAARSVIKKSEVLLIAGRHGYSNGILRRIRNHVSRWAISASRWRTAFHLDPYQQEYLASTDSVAWRLMPDPATPASKCDSGNARRLLGLPDDGTLLGCTGAISCSKGSDRLIRAFVDACPDLPDDCRLLLAGPIRKNVALQLTKHRRLVDAKKIICIDRLLSDRELDLAIQSINVMCLPYVRSYQSSGMFLRAVAEDTPVLVNDRGWMRKSVQLLQNGWRVDAENELHFSKAIAHAVNSIESARCPDETKRQRFLDFHSVANFQATWTRKLRKHLGHSKSTSIRDWHSVADTPEVQRRGKAA